LFINGLRNYCDQTETVEHFLIKCAGNVPVVDRNIKAACKKLQFDLNIKSAFSDERLFVVILANINRKIQWENFSQEGKIDKMDGHIQLTSLQLSLRGTQKMGL
jgi:hypothetical protein